MIDLILIVLAMIVIGAMDLYVAAAVLGGDPIIPHKENR